VPVLGLVPFAYEDISTVADRYLYLALIGPALVVAYFAGAYWSRATITLATSIALLFTLLSAVQVSYWIDQETLFRQCLWASPRSYVAHDKVGLADLERHEAAAAAKHFEQARDIDPTYTVTYNNLGNAYRELRRFEEAAAQYRLALEIEPTSSVARFNLGNVCLKDLDRLNEARDCFAAVIRANPNYAAAHLNLGVVLLRQGDAAGALPPLEEALRLEPGDAETFFTLGHAYWQLGRRQEALAKLEEAVRRNPAEPRYRLIWEKYRREAAAGPSP
jgi:tetratricopeptide (TPR) repeat protein